MKTQNYALAGKDVPTALAGKTLRLPIPETYREAEARVVGGEAVVVAKFADGDAIRLQGRLRNKAAKALKDAGGDADKALATLQAWIDSEDSKYSERGEGNGASDKPATPETVKTRTAKNAGNKLMDLCETNERKRAEMIKAGVFTQDEFDAYISAKNAPPTPRARKTAAPAAQA